MADHRTVPPVDAADILARCRDTITCVARLRATKRLWLDFRPGVLGRRTRALKHPRSQDDRFG